MNLYNKSIEDLNNTIINRMKIQNTAVQNSFGSFITQLKKLNQIEPENKTTIENINTIMNNPSFEQNININYL
jgi:ribosomal protein L16 Arg81 hydroxylase